MLAYIKSDGANLSFLKQEVKRYGTNFTLRAKFNLGIIASLQRCVSGKAGVLFARGIFKVR